jgi:single-strand DNA-binding protein
LASKYIPNDTYSIKKEREERMASNLNKVQLIGNLVANPELRMTVGGSQPVANFRLATNEMWKDKNGQKQSRAEFHRVVVFGKLAEVVGKYLAKGREVYVEGRLTTRKWEDKEKITRYSTEIIANQVKFLGKAPESVDIPEVTEENIPF